MFAQSPQTSLLTVVGVVLGPFAGLCCLMITCCCCALCCRFLEDRTRWYSRHVSHDNRPRNPLPAPQRSHTSTVIDDQNCQVGVVTPSRGTTVSYAPPYASTAGRPLVPIYTPVAPQYKLSGYNAAEAPPPYSSLPPPYHAVQSELVQHIRVHNEVESGAVVQAEPRLHAAEVQNEVESGTIAQTEPRLHAASDSEVQNEVESGTVVQTESRLHAASDSEVQNEVQSGTVAQAEPRLHAASDSEVHNEVESGTVAQVEPLIHTASSSEVRSEVESGAVGQREVTEPVHAGSDSEVCNEEENVDQIQVEPTIYAAPSIETPYADNQELEPTSTPRPGMEIQVERIDFQVDSDEEFSVVANPDTR